MSGSNQLTESIQQHYTRPDLGNIMLGPLEKAGKDLNRLTPEDLAPVDEFHIRGRAVTLELARAAGRLSLEVMVEWIRTRVRTL